MSAKVQRGPVVVPKAATGAACAPTVTAPTPAAKQLPQLEAPPATGAVVLAPPEGRAVSGSASLGWGTKGFWLDQTMLKPPFQTNLPLDDAFEGPLSMADVGLPALSPDDDRETVYQKLANVPLERLLVSPGYRYYRHPEQFPDVLNQVKTNNRVDSRPSIMDVTTDGHGKVVSVDLRSHHLRMAAFLELGRGKLGDLPFDQVLIKVDGVQRGDKYWPMKAHGYAVPAEVLRREGVKVVEGDDPATVELSNPPNWELGSRTTLKQFHQTLLHREQPKVGVVFGDEAGLLARALALKQQHGLDEVVVAPNGTPSEALIAAARSTEGVNLYLDQPASLREFFPQLDYPTLVKYRLNLLYGVDMHGIVGEA